VAFQNQRFQSSACGVNGRRESGAAGSKNNGIANLCHSLPESILDQQVVILSVEKDLLLLFPSSERHQIPPPSL
jgi:hypothetical protein